NMPLSARMPRARSLSLATGMGAGLGMAMGCLLTHRTSPLPLRERADRALRETGEGFFTPHTDRAKRSKTPHPPLRGTFSLKGRRGRREVGEACGACATSP